MPPALPPPERDADWMALALAEAYAAFALDEVPIGCVVVHAGRPVAFGHNRRRLDLDPSAHAEVVALRRAAQMLGRWQLPDVAVYVTLEPCPMCAGLMVNARVPLVVYGAADPKAGACGTLFRLTEDSRLNHRAVTRGGVLADESAAALRLFFAAQRARGKK